MNNENITYEAYAKYKSKDVKIILTKVNIYIEKKNIFNKYKTLKKISYSDIKLIKEKPSIKVKKSTLIIETVKNTYKIECKNILDANAIHGEIINAMTDSTMIKRTTNKIKNSYKSKGVVYTTLLVGKFAFKHKDEIVELAKKLSGHKSK